jgi:O-antigen ligase
VAWRHRERAYSIEERLFGVTVPAVLWLATFLGLAFTASRAGLAAAAAGTMAAGLMAASAAESGGRTRRRRSRMAGLTVLVIGLGLVATIGLERGLGRLLRTSPLELIRGARAQVYTETLGLWSRFPLSGSGLGSYRDAFETQQSASLHGRWDHAHNDVLELAATGGVVAILILVVGLALLSRRILRILHFGVRTEDRAAGIAAAGIFVGLLVHELLDFGLTMPANAFTAAVLLGAATAAQTAPRQARGSATRDLATEQLERDRRDATATAGMNTHDVPPRLDRNVEGNPLLASEHEPADALAVEPDV